MMGRSPPEAVLGEELNLVVSWTFLNLVYH